MRPPSCPWPRKGLTLGGEKDAQEPLRSIEVVGGDGIGESGKCATNGALELSRSHGLPSFAIAA